MRKSGLARGLTIAVALCAPLWGQSPAQELFNRVRQKVSESVGRAPDFTCTEMINRFNYLPHGARGCAGVEPLESNLRQQSKDRLRLDVGVTGFNEIYSWHGEKKFSELGLEDLVGYGAIGTGMFSSFLAAIFTEGRGTFHFERAYEANGRSISEFAFVIPREISSWKVEDRTGKSGVVGYGGTFLVDSATANLLALSIKTTDIPPAIGCCGVRIETQYHLVPLGSAVFLLPRTVESVMFSPGGSRSRDEIEYGDCHQFVGESTIHFDASDSSPEPSQDSVADEPLLPSGITLQIRLTSAIDVKENWVGDPIEGRIEASIYDSKRKLLAPKGARITGRIVRLEQFEAPYRYTDIGMSWQHLESGAAVYRLAAFLIDRTASPRPIRLGPMTSPQPSGTIVLRSGEPKLKANFVSYWITTKSQPRAQR